MTAFGTAGNASADPALQVTINGQAMSSSGPQIAATLSYDGSDQWLLSVTNASVNQAGENILEIDGGVSQAALQRGVFINEVSAQSTNPGDAFVASSQNGISFLFSTAPVNVCFEPQAAQTSFTCPTLYGGFGPGSTEQYTLITNDTTQSLPPLSSIDVQMKIGACVTKHEPLRRLQSARDDCALPGLTKIVTTKVNRKSGAVFFGYRAANARAYECELLHNKRIVNRTSCYAGKSYTGLTPGTYYFLVWASNKAGVAQKATVYGFKIG